MASGWDGQQQDRSRGWVDPQQDSSRGWVVQQQDNKGWKAGNNNWKGEDQGWGGIWRIAVASPRARGPITRDGLTNRAGVGVAIVGGRSGRKTAVAGGASKASRLKLAVRSLARQVGAHRRQHLALF